MKGESDLPLNKTTSHPFSLQKKGGEGVIHSVLTPHGSRSRSRRLAIFLGRRLRHAAVQVEGAHGVHVHEVLVAEPLLPAESQNF